VYFGLGLLNMEDRIKQRKLEHLRIVAEQEVAHTSTTLLECVKLEHQALPELALDQLDTTVEFCAKRLNAPLMITSMSGGTERGAELNRDLATVAGKLNIAFSVGSQRVMLQDAASQRDFDVREYMDGRGVLLGNIGGQQLVSHPTPSIIELAERISADGMCVHLNPAHELAQEDGDRAFSDVLSAIVSLSEQYSGFVLVKEAGAGLGPTALRMLAEAGVNSVDVAGAGGTSWTKVERYRGEDIHARAVAECFGEWGVPTAFAIIAARRLLGEQATVIGSGGILNGLDAAKAITCGAAIAGIARQMLMAWQAGGATGALHYLEQVIHELRAAMLLTGCADLHALRGVPRVYTGELKDWLAAYGWLPFEVANE
jgi:isopentenyl-diphosphate delta-isomerase